MTQILEFEQSLLHRLVRVDFGGVEDEVWIFGGFVRVRYTREFPKRFQVSGKAKKTGSGFGFPVSGKTTAAKFEYRGFTYWVSPAR